MDGDRFWQRITSAGQPPLLLPDIGTFFNSDMRQAHDLLQQVVASGVECIKGEILHDADICLPGDTEERYLDNRGQARSEPYRALIERKAVPLDDYRRLFAGRGDLGLVLSVYDFAGADFAVDIGSCALKVASTNITHLPLIRHLAGSGLPLLIDTGKASWAEVERAVGWARDAGAERLIVEYSPPAPPAPVEQHNLRVLQRLRTAFDCPVGLSDHHHGDQMLYLAAVLGARVLEKGVCPDHPADDQDVYHALPAGQLAQTLARIDTTYRALGDPAAAYAAPAATPAARMGLVAADNLAPGTALTLDKVRFAFPALGIGCERWDEVAGKSLRNRVAAGQPIREDDV